MWPKGEPAPDLALLLDWIEGRLDASSAARVDAAVAAGDPATIATVDWLRDFARLARSMPLHDPPPIVRQHLRRHFRRESRSRPDPAYEPVRLVATPLFDSRRDLALAGMRGVDEPGEVVHLAFSTDQADLVLDVTPQGPHEVSIEGQVLLADVGEARVFEATAVGPAGLIRTVDGDELGRFWLAAVPVDTTELRVTNGEVMSTLR